MPSRTTFNRIWKSWKCMNPSWRVSTVLIVFYDVRLKSLIHRQIHMLWVRCCVDCCKTTWDMKHATYTPREQNDRNIMIRYKWSYLRVHLQVPWLSDSVVGATEFRSQVVMTVVIATAAAYTSRLPCRDVQFKSCRMSCAFTRIRKCYHVLFRRSYHPDVQE